MKSIDERISTILIVSAAVSLVVGIDYFLSHRAVVPVDLSKPLVTNTKNVDTSSSAPFDIGSIEFDSAKTQEIMQKKGYVVHILPYLDLCKSVRKAQRFMQGEVVSPHTVEQTMAKFKWIAEGKDNIYTFLNAEQKDEINRYYQVMIALQQYGSMEGLEKSMLTQLSPEKRKEFSEFLNRCRNK